MVKRRVLLGGAGAAAVAAAGMAIAGEINEARADDGVPASPRVAVRNRALLLVDRSGSMSSLRQAVVDGLNGFIAEQRDKPDLLLTLLQFDSTWDTTSGRTTKMSLIENFVDKPAALIEPLTLDDYVPTGGTPLYQAMAAAIRRLEEDECPGDKILFLVQTDGGDTDGGEMSRDVLKDLIASKQAQGNWTFVFMGADIDAWGASGALGIVGGNTTQYANTYGGTVKNFATTSASTDAWYRSDQTQTRSFYDANIADVKA